MSAGTGGLEKGQPYDYLAKVIVLGPSSTGKTCLLHHFVNEQPKDGAAHTIGVEFASRFVRIGKKGLKLQLWDTAGQERFFSVVKNYYRGASACILVFDLTQRATFESLDRWLVDARQLASPDLVVVLVGNKLDRAETERQVSYDEARQWASDRGITAYVETASLDAAINVDRPFMIACETILQGIEGGCITPEAPGSGISYGDRGLRSVRRGANASSGSAGGIPSSASGRFNFADMAPSSPNNNGTVTLSRRMTSKFDGCC